MAIPLPAVMGGMQLLGNVFKLGSQSRREKLAERALAKLQYKDLTNVTEGMSVSALGAENKLRESSRNFATTTEALRETGVRGVVGGLSKALSATDEINKNITADLDRQRKEINRLAAIDDARIRQMEEARVKRQITGLSNELGVSQTGQQDALTGMFSSLGTISASLFGEEEKEDGEEV